MEVKEKLVVSRKKFKNETTIVSARIPSDIVSKIDELGKKANRNRNEMIQILLAYAVDNCVVKDSDTEEGK